jgi:hypothetical protein
MRWTLLLALLPTLAFAQSSVQSTTPRPEDLGTITGHITCADTQRPARFAQVSLVAIRTSDINTDYQRPFSQRDIHTDLTGGYIISEVQPGQYYLVVDLAGYATPLSQFTPDELNSPTPAIQQRIQRELQVVTITPNATLQADATIHRGGSITGRIMYDDGSPLITTNVLLLRRDSSGKFRNPVRNSVFTDSHGEFTIESLSPGEYILQIKLIATEQRMLSVTNGDGKARKMFMAVLVSSLPIYSGNVFQQRDATILKVEAGQETDGVDLTIPLGRLHEISGTLLAKDGHVINDGKVALLFADTQEELTSVRVQDNGIFHLAYVPEGNYVLTATNVHDIVLDEEPDSPTPSSPTHPVRRTTHTYGDLQQPLTVQTSDQSLTLTLPDSPAPPNNSTDDN